MKEQRSHKTLYVAFTAMGIVGGLIGRDLIDIDSRPTRSSAHEEQQPQQSSVIYEATIAHDIHNALFPTPTITRTPTPEPTATATPVPSLYDRTPICNDHLKDGELCRFPHPPTPTRTPYPECTDTMPPGTYCIFRREEVTHDKPTTN